MNILEEIVARKRARLRQDGPELGSQVPVKRAFPVVPFIRDPFLICEIKRKSPSKGNIAAGLDAVAQAALYRSHKVRSVSVLTEQDYFAGSLDDLIQVKQNFPDLAVLRKDFLLSKEDIEVSHRAGADAVLLIAAVLDQQTLAGMYHSAKALGIQPLVEVHDQADLEKVKDLRPDLTGINARDLSRFKTDLTIPLQLRREITWDTSLLFESGIHSEEEARFALDAGFRGLLVGEAVVRNPALITELQESFPGAETSFWKRLYSRRPPYVKICGITNRADAEHAAACGADILGFLFASSKRRAAPELLYELAGLDILKAAVVVTDEYHPPRLPPEIVPLLEQGLLDVVQFHGDESPADCYRMAFPYYKVVRINSEEDISLMQQYRCPRVMVDAFCPDQRGGTGRVIPPGLVEKIRARHTLWLAGGIGMHNIRKILADCKPELIDASTNLEKSPGRKDPVIITAYLKEIRGA